MEKVVGIERTANQIAEHGMGMLHAGKIRNHKLGNSSPDHTGEIEKREYQQFRDFLPSKNSCMIYGLTGSECYEYDE